MMRSIDSTVTTSPLASASVTGRLGSGADAGVEGVVVERSAASTAPHADANVSPITSSAFRLTLRIPNR
jgi:hypothetical protein